MTLVFTKNHDQRILFKTDYSWYAFQVFIIYVCSKFKLSLNLRNCQKSKISKPITKYTSYIYLKKIYFAKIMLPLCQMQQYCRFSSQQFLKYAMMYWPKNLMLTTYNHKLHVQSESFNFYFCSYTTYRNKKYVYLMYSLISIKADIPNKGI